MPWENHTIPAAFAVASATIASMAFHSQWIWTIKYIALTIITICLRQNVLAARRVSTIDISTPYELCILII